MKILSTLLNETTNLGQLAADLDIPIHTGLQHQGDVTVVPQRMAADFRPPTDLVPRAGVPVVRGENGGNTHLLLADGPVTFTTRTPTAGDLTLGCLAIPDGSVAYLDHPEHGNSGIGPGHYVLRRKREMGEELRLVAD